MTIMGIVTDAIQALLVEGVGVGIEKVEVRVDTESERAVMGEMFKEL